MGKSNLYVGQDLIGNIYAGNQLISQVYHGSTKVYDVYYDGEIVFESAIPGTYTFTPKVKGLYQIILVGAGGGGAAQGDQPKYAWKSSAGGGGSGAYVAADYFLTKETSYSITVGSGGTGRGGGSYHNWITGDAGTASSFGPFITCNGGGGGGAMFTDGAPGRYGGSGGTYTITGSISVEESTNGNDGGTNTSYNTASGGAAKFGNYGGGGNAQATGYNSGWGATGGNGFIRITYLRHSTGT